MIETAEQREERLKEEEVVRRVRIDAYNRKMNLPVSEETESGKQSPSLRSDEAREGNNPNKVACPNQQDSRGGQKPSGKKRDAKWWQEYRKRQKEKKKACPHCGEKL